MLTVEQKRVVATFWDTDAVIRACYRSEVADEEETLFVVTAVTDEAENAPVAVVCIDPLEAIPVVICLGERRIFLINM